METILDQLNWILIAREEGEKLQKGLDGKAMRVFSEIVMG